MWIERKDLESVDPDIKSEVVLLWMEHLAEIFANPESITDVVKVTYQDNFFEEAFFYLFDKSTGSTTVKGIQEEDKSRRPFEDVIQVFTAHWILLGEDVCRKRMRDWLNMLIKQTEKGQKKWQKV